MSILTNATIVGAGKVFSNHTVAVEEDLLPVLNVITLQEESAPRDFGRETLDRILTVTVQGVAKNTDDATIDDTLDELAEDIEAAMAADDTISGKALDSYLIGTEAVVESEAEVVIGIVNLTYRVRYEA